MARQLNQIHSLNMNVSGRSKEITIKENARSALYEKDYSGNDTIAAYEAVFIEIK